MRKLTAGLFHSIDGVVEGRFNVQFVSFDDELGAELGKVMATTDTVLLSYEDWVGYRPAARQDMGGAV